jgi:hypothetical protein
MSRDQFNKKLEFFMDYYFLKTAAVCFGIFVVALFLVHYFLPSRETALYVAVYDMTLDAGKTEALCQDLAGISGEGTGTSQIIVDDSFRSDSGKDVERLQVLAANRAVDVIICPQRDIMEAYAGYGYLMPLPDILSPEAAERAQTEGRLIMTPGMLWTDEISFEDHESGRGPKKPYVLDISSTPGWESIAGSEAAGWLGVVLDSPHEKMVSVLINELMER